MTFRCPNCHQLYMTSDPRDLVCPRCLHADDRMHVRRPVIPQEESQAPRGDDEAQAGSEKGGRHDTR